MSLRIHPVILILVVLSSFICSVISCSFTVGSNARVDYADSLGNPTSNTVCDPSNALVAPTCLCDANHVCTCSTSTSCVFGCAAGYYDSTYASNVDMVATCNSGAFDHSPDSASRCLVYVCDQPPSTLSSFTDVSCNAVSRTSRLTLSQTCSVTVPVGTGTADFSSGVGSKSTYFICANSNVYTAPTLEAACDAVPTAITNLNADSGAWSPNSGTGGCAVVPTTPLRVSTGSCTLDVNAPYFSFGSTGTGFGTSFTSFSVTCAANGGGNYFLNSALYLYKACSAPATSTTVTIGYGSSIDTSASTNSNDCNYATSSHAIRETSSCKLNLVSGYYDFQSATSNPPTQIGATCSDASTNTYAVIGSPVVDIGCNASPSSVANTGFTGPNSNRIIISTATTTSGSGLCTDVSSVNVLRKGSSCKVNLDTANRYYDVATPSSPKTTIDLYCNAVGNVYTPATSPVIAQACVNPSFVILTPHVVVGACTGVIADSQTCLATCDSSSNIDPTQSSSPATYFTYTCTASTNLLTISGSNPPPSCLPTACTTPPAFSDMYDFTDGATPCAAVDSSRSVAVGATCTLKCKRGYYPKNNVVPTFTCDSTTQTLVPTNVDICEQVRVLPTTFYFFGTKMG